MQLNKLFDITTVCLYKNRRDLCLFLLYLIGDLSIVLTLIRPIYVLSLNLHFRCAILFIFVLIHFIFPRSIVYNQAMILSIFFWNNIKLVESINNGAFKHVVFFFEAFSSPRPPLVFQHHFIFKQQLLISLFILLDLLLYLLEQIAKNHSLRSGTICEIFQGVYLRNLFVMLVKNLFDVVFNLFHMFLVPKIRLLLACFLFLLHHRHLPFEQGNQLIQYLLNGHRDTCFLYYLMMLVISLVSSFCSSWNLIRL